VLTLFFIASASCCQCAKVKGVQLLRGATLTNAGRFLLKAVFPATSASLAGNIENELSMDYYLMSVMLPLSALCLS
jgi:hypothetical protein